ILIGGTTDNTFDTVSDENYFYDVNNDSWTELTSKPTAWNTGNAASLMVDGVWKLVCAGGVNENYLRNTEIYSQENLAVSDVETSQCSLKNMKTIGGKNPKLSFCTKENGTVGMLIWNSEGRLVGEKKKITSEAGQHLVSIQGLNLTSGIYFVTLTQNGESQSKKIQIMK